MGLNTGVLLLNDNFGNIKDNPVNFTERMFESIFSFRGNPVDFNFGKVFHMTHADTTSVYAIGGNCTTRLLPNAFTGSHHHTPEDKLAILKQLASEMGYEVHKKRKK